MQFYQSKQSNYAEIRSTQTHFPNNSNYCILQTCGAVDHVVFGTSVSETVTIVAVSMLVTEPVAKAFTVRFDFANKIIFN